MPQAEPAHSTVCGAAMAAQKLISLHEALAALHARREVFEQSAPFEHEGAPHARDLPRAIADAEAEASKIAITCAHAAILTLCLMAGDIDEMRGRGAFETQFARLAHGVQSLRAYIDPNGDILPQAAALYFPQERD